MCVCVHSSVCSACAGVGLVYVTRRYNCRINGVCLGFSMGASTCTNIIDAQ